MINGGYGMTEKRFTAWSNKIRKNGKLLNINFETKTDAKLCCKLCNQLDKDNQEYIDKLDEIFKWYKEYYDEAILDTKMGWNENNKISKLKKENEQLKKEKKELQSKANIILAFYNKRYCDAIFNGQRHSRILRGELWIVKEVLSELGLYEDE